MPRTIITLSVLATVTLGARVATVDPARAGAETTRKIYLSVADSKGVPVTDLTAADVTVKEGGKAYPVTSLQPATAPMQVALIVDDRGSGAFQNAVAQFLQKSFGKGQFAITTLSPEVVRLVDFTDNADALRDGLVKLGQRARVAFDGDQLLGAIMESANALQQRKAERPIIVVMTTAGGQPGSVDPKRVLTVLRSSGASLNIVFGTGSDLGEVLLDGPKQSGGRSEEAGTGAAIAPAAARLADALLRQYVLTYTLPDGVKMSDKVAIETSRKGVTLTAPTRLPDK